MVAPAVNGWLIEVHNGGAQGYYLGYTVTALLQIAGGLAGLLLLWPGCERARLASNRPAFSVRT